MTGRNNEKEKKQDGREIPPLLSPDSFSAVLEIWIPIQIQKDPDRDPDPQNCRKNCQGRRQEKMK